MTNWKGRMIPGIVEKLQVLLIRFEVKLDCAQRQALGLSLYWPRSSRFGFSEVIYAQLPSMWNNRAISRFTDAHLLWITLLSKHFGYSLFLHLPLHVLVRGTDTSGDIGRCWQGDTGNILGDSEFSADRVSRLTWKPDLLQAKKVRAVEPESKQFWMAGAGSKNF